VATADLFPRVNLSGLLGLASSRAGDLGESGSAQASLGAFISWPVLDFGRVRSRIAVNESRARQALVTYELAVATALEEAERAMNQFTRTAAQSERLARAAASAREASELARLRFDVGVVDFLIVLDAERQALSARDALVVSQVAQATSLVAIYRALGGGWSPTEASSAVSAVSTRP
ncbi:MAG: TolC family protein, partial [Chitinophagaceae bacterium]|nr:TolC family protein [Rubrivivax sp.]